MRGQLINLGRVIKGDKIIQDGKAYEVLRVLRSSGRVPADGNRKVIVQVTGDVILGRTNDPVRFIHG